MEVIVGKTAAFCYGVKRAVEGAEKEVKNTVDWLRNDFREKVSKAENIKELMACEGEAWEK